MAVLCLFLRAQGRAGGDQRSRPGVLFAPEVDLADSLSASTRGAGALEAPSAGEGADMTLLQLAPPTLQFPATRGRALHCSDEEYRTDFADQVLRSYLDGQVKMEIFHREVMEEMPEGRFYG